MGAEAAAELCSSATTVIIGLVATVAPETRSNAGKCKGMRLG